VLLQVTKRSGFVHFSVLFALFVFFVFPVFFFAFRR
jgi:hypothetical protein